MGYTDKPKETGLCLIYRNTYGNHYEWYAYACYKAQDDYKDASARQCPYSFSTSYRDEWHLADFGVRFQWFGQDFSTPHWGCYPSFDPFRVDSPDHCQAMAKTLTKLEKGLAKLSESQGPATTPGHYLCNVCKVLGLKSIVIKRQNGVCPYSGIEYDWEVPGLAVMRVNSLIEEKGK